MSERRFEQSINRHKAIEQEFHDEGIKSSQEWRGAVCLEKDKNNTENSQAMESLKASLVPEQGKELSPEQLGAKKYVLQNIGIFNPLGDKKFIDYLSSLPKEVILSEEIQNKVESKLTESIKTHNLSYDLEFAKIFPLSEKTLHKLRNITKKKILDWYKHNHDSGALELTERAKFLFGNEDIVNTDEVKKTREDGLIYCLRDGSEDRFFGLKEKLNLPDDIFERLEIQEATKEGFKKAAKGGWVFHVDKFPFLTTEFIKKTVEEVLDEAFESVSSQYDMEDAFKISERFHSQNYFQEKIKKFIKSKLIEDSPNYHWIGIYISAARSSKEFFRDTAKEAMIDNLAKGEIQKAREMLEVFMPFNLSDIIGSYAN